MSLRAGTIIRKENNPIDHRLPPPNPRYQHIGPVVNTGFNVRKYLDQNDQPTNARFQKEEPFKRIRPDTLYHLITEEQRFQQFVQAHPEEETPPPPPPPPGPQQPGGFFFGQSEPPQSPASAPSATGRCFLLLDVRDEESFAQCRIKTAQHYPLAMLSRSVNAFTPEIYDFRNKPDRVIILYCNDERESSRAATIFFERGVDNAILLTGGLRPFTWAHPDVIDGVPPWPAPAPKGLPPRRRDQINPSGIPPAAATSRPATAASAASGGLEMTSPLRIQKDANVIVSKASTEGCSKCDPPQQRRDAEFVEYGDSIAIPKTTSARNRLYQQIRRTYAMHPHTASLPLGTASLLASEAEAQMPGSAPEITRPHSSASLLRGNGSHPPPGQVGDLVVRASSAFGESPHERDRAAFQRSTVLFGSTSNIALLSHTQGPSARQSPPPPPPKRPGQQSPHSPSDSSRSSAPGAAATVHRQSFPMSPASDERLALGAGGSGSDRDRALGAVVVDSLGAQRRGSRLMEACSLIEERQASLRAEKQALLIASATASQRVRWPSRPSGHPPGAVEGQRVPIRDGHEDASPRPSEDHLGQWRSSDGTQSSTPSLALSPSPRELVASPRASDSSASSSPRLVPPPGPHPGGEPGRPPDTIPEEPALPDLPAEQLQPPPGAAGPEVLRTSINQPPTPPSSPRLGAPSPGPSPAQRLRPKRPSSARPPMDGGLVVGPLGERRPATAASAMRRRGGPRTPQQPPPTTSAPTESMLGSGYIPHRAFPSHHPMPARGSPPHPASTRPASPSPLATSSPPPAGASASPSASPSSSPLLPPRPPSAGGSAASRGLYRVSAPRFFPPLTAALGAPSPPELRVAAVPSPQPSPGPPDIPQPPRPAQGAPHPDPVGPIDLHAGAFALGAVPPAPETGRDSLALSASTTSPRRMQLPPGALARTTSPGPAAPASGRSHTSAPDERPPSRSSGFLDPLDECEWDPYGGFVATALPPPQQRPLDSGAPSSAGPRPVAATSSFPAPPPPPPQGDIGEGDPSAAGSELPSPNPSTQPPGDRAQPRRGEHTAAAIRSSALPEAAPASPASPLASPAFPLRPTSARPGSPSGGATGRSVPSRPPSAASARPTAPPPTPAPSTGGRATPTGASRMGRPQSPLVREPPPASQPTLPEVAPLRTTTVELFGADEGEGEGEGGGEEALPSPEAPAPGRSESPTPSPALAQRASVNRLSGSKERGPEPYWETSTGGYRMPRLGALLSGAMSTQRPHSPPSPGSPKARLGHGPGGVGPAVSFAPAFPEGAVRIETCPPAAPAPARKAAPSPLVLLPPSGPPLVGESPLSTTATPAGTPLTTADGLLAGLPALVLAGCEVPAILSPAGAMSPCTARPPTATVQRHPFSVSIESRGPSTSLPQGALLAMAAATAPDAPDGLHTALADFSGAPWAVAVPLLEQPPADPQPQVAPAGTDGLPCSSSSSSPRLPTGLATPVPLHAQRQFPAAPDVSLRASAGQLVGVPGHHPAQAWGPSPAPPTPPPALVTGSPGADSLQLSPTPRPTPVPAGVLSSRSSATSDRPLPPACRAATSPPPPAISPPLPPPSRPNTPRAPAGGVGGFVAAVALVENASPSRVARPPDSPHSTADSPKGLPTTLTLPAPAALRPRPASAHPFKQHRASAGSLRPSSALAKAPTHIGLAGSGGLGGGLTTVRLEPPSDLQPPPRAAVPLVVALRSAPLLAAATAGERPDANNILRASRSLGGLLLRPQTPMARWRASTETIRFVPPGRTLDSFRERPGEAEGGFTTPPGPLRTLAHRSPSPPRSPEGPMPLGSVPGAELYMTSISPPPSPLAGIPPPAAPPGNPTVVAATTFELPEQLPGRHTDGTRVVNLRFPSRRPLRQAPGPAITQALAVPPTVTAVPPAPAPGTRNPTLPPPRRTVRPSSGRLFPAVTTLAPTLPPTLGPLADGVRGSMEGSLASLSSPLRLRGRPTSAPMGVRRPAGHYPGAGPQRR
ncbi:putative centrosomal protein CEP41 [Paratrimastix pyriformis]|uniref:Centrosomal protein CEP41 n=1 Tax=Paratrimastix pyriformis TaxID=342808 RepID=A0ABQ8UTL1_9EUKA|nr:putative centrosomal protein CEP41 [Paratrimastix pyriformis]